MSKKDLSPQAATPQKTDEEKEKAETSGDDISDYLPQFEVDVRDFEKYVGRTCEICLCDAPLTPCEMNDTGTDTILLCQACSMSPIGDILFRTGDYNANLVTVADMLAHVTNIFINNIKELEERLDSIDTNIDILEASIEDSPTIITRP